MTSCKHKNCEVVNDASLSIAQLGHVYSCTNNTFGDKFFPCYLKWTCVNITSAKVGCQAIYTLAAPLSPCQGQLYSYRPKLGSLLILCFWIKYECLIALNAIRELNKMQLNMELYSGRKYHLQLLFSRCTSLVSSSLSWNENVRFLINYLERTCSTDIFRYILDTENIDQNRHNP